MVHCFFKVLYFHVPFFIGARADNLYSSGMLRPFIIEFFILLIHPVPFVHFEIHLHEVFGYTIYTSDDFFTVLMLPRVYLLARVLRDELKLTHETVNYHGCPISR